MLPEVTRRLEQVHGDASVPYDNFVDARDPRKRWETFGSEARYGTNYIGLRNRFAILDENYAYADFRTRVCSCYAFLEAILLYTRVDGRQMRTLVRAVDRAAVACALDSARCFVARWRLEELPDPVELLSYEFVRVTDEQGGTFSRPTERPHTYRLPYFGQYVPTATVPLPAAHLFPAQVREVAAKLVQHSVVVERLAQPCTHLRGRISGGKDRGGAPLLPGRLSGHPHRL